MTHRSFGRQAALVTVFLLSTRAWGGDHLHLHRRTDRVRNAPAMPADRDIRNYQQGFGNAALVRPDCENGFCEPYYGIRPFGCKEKKRRIQLHNLINEPDWYKYYRYQHFGYYPTQWAPWPDGWLTCRQPHPGPHPYDIKQPESTPPRSSTERRPVLDRAPRDGGRPREPERLETPKLEPKKDAARPDPLSPPPPVRKGNGA